MLALKTAPAANCNLNMKESEEPLAFSICIKNMLLSDELRPTSRLVFIKTKTEALIPGTRGLIYNNYCCKLVSIITFSIVDM